MTKIQVSFFVLLVSCIAITVGILIVEKYQPPLSGTFSPLFQELGKPVKSIDRAITKVMSISEIDEQMLGEAIKEQFEKDFPREIDPETVDYLNSLIQTLYGKTSKKFKYTVYLGKGSPNAYALPGGVMVITKSMIECLSSEAELVAILSHEIGHIERGHTLDSVRNELLLKKITWISIPDFATYAINSFRLCLFSKTQEAEADEYAFKMLVETGYNPFAISDVFVKLSGEGSHKHSLLTDFFSSHPYEILRSDKFRSQAKNWLANYPETKMYTGKRNFEEKTSRYDLFYLDEHEIPKDKIGQI